MTKKPRTKIKKTRVKRPKEASCSSCKVKFLKKNLRKYRGMLLCDKCMKKRAIV